MQKPDKPTLRIRTVRESKGYTQEYMAEMMGICQSTYAHLESGKTRLSIDRLITIATILDVDLTVLIEIKKLNGATHHTAVIENRAAAGTGDPVERSVYDTLIEEMRAEIRFLRSLVRPVEG